MKPKGAGHRILEEKFGEMAPMGGIRLKLPGSRGGKCAGRLTR